jgi:uncharacterized protein YxeA
MATKDPDSRKNRFLIIFAVLLLVLIVTGGFFIFRAFNYDSNQAELVMGIVVVTAIVALMTLLYIFAVGFNSMGLTDKRQALGLPDGSIRAMIALILIMVFIIFGIYLFRNVAYGFNTTLESAISYDSLKRIDLEKYKDLTIWVDSTKIDTGKVKLEKYSVHAVSKTSDDGNKLAQQLLTTVGTLVVAISSFYFGSSSVNSAIASAKRNKDEQEEDLKDKTGPPGPTDSKAGSGGTDDKKGDGGPDDKKVADGTDDKEAAGGAPGQSGG